MMAPFTKRQFVRYAVLPGVRPRLQELFFSGFKYIPYFIALVYHTVKLLPANHPYIDPLNIGRFGIRHVIAEAANNLTLSRKNIDQIILFGVVLFGLMIVFAQIVLLMMAFFMKPVLAGVAMPTNFAGFFQTPAPAQDIAFIMLDLVFGVPNFFNSCVAAGTGCVDVNGALIVDNTNQWILAPLGWPMPIHEGLHAMFRIYSIGLLVVAAFITIYFIFTVALETAQTGTPFGKRFNKLWAPLRIVVAFGLLIPLGTPGAGAGGAGGLNSSQYIVLYAAKFGSSFATNGWNIFNQAITDSYVGQTANLVSTPNGPDVGGLLQFMYVASTCREFQASLTPPVNVEAYVVKDPLSTNPNMVFAPVSAPGSPSTFPTYESIIQFIEGASNIVIRFGVIETQPGGGAGAPLVSHYKGFVNPICGEMIIPLADSRDPTPAPPAGSEDGAETMQRYYVYAMQEMWADVFSGAIGLPAIAPSPGFPPTPYPRNTVLRYSARNPNATALLPTADYRRNLHDFYKRDVVRALTNAPSLGVAEVPGPGAVPAQVASASWAVNAVLRAKGWGGAGIWYNKIAEMNGSVAESALGVPAVSKWPTIMEYVRLKKRQQDQNVPIKERFNPQLAGRNDVPASDPVTQDFAMVLWKAFDYWQSGDFSTSSHTEPTGNMVIDGINMIFGTEGLFNMRKNVDVHPLAQLTGIGKGLVEASIRNMTFATVVAGGAAGMSTFDQFGGATGYAVASFMVSLVMITMSAGFILYYIVPFLPFIYFFFAIGGWLKAIFEAMVGAPLWALAHIRIDGNGLPGAAAVNGYFLIFEIFLRPILIIFGLLASISIFAAMVSALNQIWDLVTSNLTGFDVVYETTNPGTIAYFRQALDEFFFTIIYAIIVYMMGMASFKLIDLIPANILRWMGQSVATENDAKENAAESLVSTSSVGSQQVISGLGGSLKGSLDKAAENVAKSP